MAGPRLGALINIDTAAAAMEAAAAGLRAATAAVAAALEGWEEEGEGEGGGGSGEAANVAAPDAPDAPAPAPTPLPEPALASPAAWPAFDILDSPAPADHAFYAPPPPPAPPRSWAKAVSREWGALADGLPAGAAWARAWEGRMDLVRFALAGAPGTPYHDHLFLFDAAFPADYPASPPRLAYHAHGVRVNPNLYACGKVCLSLLGTWAGTRPGEAWDPAASTLLQVIVSLQGLVLTAEPYYQEAGYEAQRADGGAGGAGAGGGGPASQEAAKNARLYSESAFLAAARTGLGLVRRPPPPFGPLIRAHYKARAGPYLAACGAYVRGEAGIGAWEEEEEEKKEEGEGRDAQAPPAASASASASAPPPPPPTEGFRLMLKGLVPTLEEAFGKL